MSDFRVSVVYPCLNERESIGTCVEEALRAFAAAGVDCEVIVADNGSTDGSAEIAAAAGARVVHEQRRGYGAAVVAAVEASTGDVVLTSDADGTYPIEEGPELAKQAYEIGALVLGSRFSGRIEPGAMPVLHRLVGSPATRLMLRVLLGVRCADPHTGMRAMTRGVFDAICPEARGWEFTVEQLVNAKRAGVEIREMPIDFRRRVGTSKLRALPQGWGFFRFLVLHSPTFLFVVPGLVAMLAGLALLAWLVPADRTIGRLTLGINSLVVGALATIVGYQIALLGASARAYLSARRHGPVPGPLQRRFSLERGVVVGTVLLSVGVALVAAVAAQWFALDFGELSRTAHGTAVAGLVAAVVGMQTIFSSFFLSLITEGPAGRS